MRGALFAWDVPGRLAPCPFWLTRSPGDQFMSDGEAGDAYGVGMGSGVRVGVGDGVGVASSCS